MLRTKQLDWQSASEVGGIVNYTKENTYEFHLPGQNFTGPGTHVYQRINEGILPTNHTDMVTMLHDIDYLIAAGDERATAIADDRAIQNAQYYGKGLLVKIGLYIRKQFKLPFNNNTQNRNLGKQLMYKVKNDPNYACLFDYYGINPNDYP